MNVIIYSMLLNKQNDSTLLNQPRFITRWSVDTRTPSIIHFLHLQTWSQRIAETAVTNITYPTSQSPTYQSTPDASESPPTCQQSGETLSTVGVDIGQLILTNGQRDVIFNTWDFGGQVSLRTRTWLEVTWVKIGDKLSN